MAGSPCTMASSRSRGDGKKTLKESRRPATKRSSFRDGKTTLKEGKPREKLEKNGQCRAQTASGFLCVTHLRNLVCHTPEKYKFYWPFTKLCVLKFSIDIDVLFYFPINHQSINHKLKNSGGVSD